MLQLMKLLHSQLLEAGKDSHAKGAFSLVLFL